jgi:hypothetical protein
MIHDVDLVKLCMVINICHFAVRGITKHSIKLCKPLCHTDPFSYIVVFCAVTFVQSGSLLLTFRDTHCLHLHSLIVL